jgi:hypothetical protein
MSRNREKFLPAAPDFDHCKLPFLVVCFTAVTLGLAHAQNISSSPKSLAGNKICEGNQPSQTASQQASGDSQSATEDEPDRVKLSTKAGQEPSEPQGQFCWRGQDSLRPSVNSDQPDDASKAAQTASAAPIAQVTDGKITIKANGQDLAAVLESVRSATGITVETPSIITPEPVFLDTGPTSITDALVALLSGSKYNYIIVGSEQNPGTVKRLILSERTSGAAATLVASQAPPVAPQPALYGGVQAENDAEGSDSPPSPPPPIQPKTIPSSIPTGINIQKLAAESGKSPGQILDELQKRQQQVLDDQAASQSQPSPQQ